MMASYSFLYQLYLIELNEGFIQLYINRKIDLLQIMIFQLLLANSLSLPEATATGPHSSKFASCNAIPWPMSTPKVASLLRKFDDKMINHWNLEVQYFLTNGWARQRHGNRQI